MKLRDSVLLILVIIIADQALKIWIKTSFTFGHVTNMLGFDWAQLYFIENEGMAWGWKWGGEWGKMLLTLFRLAAVLFGTWYLGRIVKQRYTKGFIICASLIYAGALGNLIDSMFYGMIFESSENGNVAGMFTGNGYAGFLHGHVVDMLYFPMVDTTWPSWVPWLGGSRLEFFSPIFNIADASISIGVITLLIFQKKLVRKEEPDIQQNTITTNTQLSDKAQVM